MWSIRRSQAVSGVVAAVLGCGSALAQESPANFPTKPIRIVVTSGVGGAVELHARMYGQPLSEILGQPIIIDNRNGFNIGAPMVAKAKPDGYSWLAVAADFSTAPSLEADLPVDPLKDFAPISMLSQTGYFLVVNPKLPVKTVQELIKLAKEKPGSLSVSGGLPGTGSSMVGIWFSSEAKIQTVQVPYKSASAAITDLIAGRIEVSFAGSNAVSFIRSGKVRALGISLPKRSPQTPEIPTIAEQGLPEYVVSNYRGLVATAGTPPAIISRVSTEIGKIGKRPEMLKLVSADGSDPITMTPEEFKKFLVEDTARWTRVIKENNIKHE